MSWFKVDDKSWGHTKVVAAGNAAWGALCRLGAYASDHLTDGKIPAHVAKLIATDDEINKLLLAGLLDQNSDESWTIHDFLDWNPSAREVAKLRKIRAKAGTNGGKQSGKQRRSKTEAKAKQVLAPGFAFASDIVEAKPNPVPSRSRPDPEERESATAPPAPDEETGTRLSPAARCDAADVYLAEACAIADEEGRKWNYSNRGEREHAASAIETYGPKGSLDERYTWIRSTLREWRKLDPDRSMGLMPMRFADWLREGKRTRASATQMRAAAEVRPPYLRAFNRDED